MTRRIEPQCPNKAAHTQGVDCHADAVRISHMNDQTQCPDSGLWAIWVLLAASLLTICWSCQERNVDPTTLKSGGEPMCPGCRAEEARRLEAQRWRMVSARWADAP